MEYVQAAKDNAPKDKGPKDQYSEFLAHLLKSLPALYNHVELCVAQARHAATRNSACRCTVRSPPPGQPVAPAGGRLADGNRHGMQAASAHIKT